MNRKVIISIIICLVGSTLVVIVLNIASGSLIHRKNSFLRLYPHIAAKTEKRLKLKHTSYYIAGVSKNHVYLGNYLQPNEIITANFALTETQQVRFKVPDSTEFILGGLRMQIDSPNVYMADLLLSSVWHATFTDPYLKTLIDSPHFSSFLVRYKSRNTFFLRTFDSIGQQSILAKLTIDPPGVKLGKKTLKKQVDGYFCTDGMLIYDKHSASLLYVYFYRNQFIRLDTNLNVLYEGQTIDTVSQANVKVAKFQKGDKTTMSAPPLTVNSLTSTFDHWLFIISPRPAKNENDDAFDTGFVIDAYDINNGKYGFSFYLPNPVKEKIRSFEMVGQKAIAIIKNELVIFDIGGLENFDSNPDNDL